MNVYHFDMPAYLFRRGGWENREVVEAYASYAEKAFRAFGKEIRCWFTFNEPIVEPDQRYQNGVWYPCLHNFNRAKAVQYNISIAHSLAVAAYRRAKADGCMLDDSRIGLINCFTPPYTRENPSEADLEAVRMTDGINNRWWLDLVTEGKLPADILADFAARGVELPVRPGDEQILAQGKVDWLGCNYYHPERVQAPSRDVDEAGCPVFAEPYVWPEAKMNESRGWEIYPKGIYDFGMKLKNDYPGLEFFVSENGMGVEREWELRDPATGEIADDYRIEFVREHLAWIARAIACVVVGISSFVVMMPQAVTATLGNILVATNAADKLAESISVNVSDLSVKLADGYALTGVEASGVLSTSCTGTNGLFGAIIVGLLAVTLFIKLSGVEKLKVNLGEGVPPAVADSFNVMIPMLLTISVCGIVAAVLAAAFGTDLMTIISTCIAAPHKGIMNASPWAVVVIYTLANLLFCLGIHQSTISGVLAEPILTMLIVDNMATFASGQPIPADHYMNMQIVNSFALIGGSGCTLALLLDTFVFSKSKSSKTVAKMAILPGLFNINEPVIYGYPIVFNLPLMIPFVLVPDLFIAVTYGLTCAGIIAPCVVQVPWTTPAVISAFLTTGGDIRAAIWQVLEIVIAMAIYLPFMKVSERVQAKQAVLAEESAE